MKPMIYYRIKEYIFHIGAKWDKKAVKEENAIAFLGLSAIALNSLMISFAVLILYIPPLITDFRPSSLLMPEHVSHTELV